MKQEPIIVHLSILTDGWSDIAIESVCALANRGIIDREDVHRLLRKLGDAAARTSLLNGSTAENGFKPTARLRRAS